MKISSTLKHLFIPHIGNDYKPHFLREHVTLSLIIGCQLLLIISLTVHTVLRTTLFGSSVVASVLIDLTNETRKDNLLPPLSRNIQLERAAMLKGKDMATKHYFSHDSPNGATPWYWLTEAGYKFMYGGENLAVNFTSSKAVKDAWLNSPKHKENILNENYEDIGIAVVHSYLGETPLTFVVQMFGKQSSPDKNVTKYFRYATWYEHLLFNIPFYLKYVFVILEIIAILALCLLIFVEIKKQHLRHILYGILLILVVAICAVINSFLL